MMGEAKYFLTAIHRWLPFRNGGHPELSTYNCRKWIRHLIKQYRYWAAMPNDVGGEA